MSLEAGEINKKIIALGEKFQVYCDIILEYHNQNFTNNN